MATETLKRVAATLVQYCREGKEEQGLEELYDPAAVSVESAPGPGGGSPVTEGIEGIRGKHAWWAANFEVHGGTVEGPFLHGDDRFAVIFEIDATEKASGQRWQMREVAIYTVGDAGRILREEFYAAL